MDQPLFGNEDPATGTDPVGKLAPPFHIIDNLLPADLADEMRGDIDTHFRFPFKQTPEKHDIWNYWFVNGSFLYLKAESRRVIPSSRMDLLLAAVRAAAVTHLGVGQVGEAHLNYFFPGCHLDWHTDAGQGSFAFIYSLTRNDRRTAGGQTLIMRDPETILTPINQPRNGVGLYHAIEPKFNRLLLLDQRSAHAVRKVEGSMHPSDGRFVLQGRVDFGSPVVQGALPARTVSTVLAPLRVRLGEIPAGHKPCHGPVSLRLNIAASGTVGAASVLYHRVRALDGSAADSAAIAQDKLSIARDLRFPVADGPSEVCLLSIVGAAPPYADRQGK